MEPTELREPSINELVCLSALGNVVFAVRCARRMRPKFVLPDSEPDAAKMTEFVDAALRWAEAYVSQGIGNLERANHLAEAASAIAEATYEHTDYAAYSTYHAVRGALLAAQAGETCNQEAFMEIVASAFGSSRVLLSNTPPWIRAQVVQILSADYAKLLELTATSAVQRGPFVDATEAGPLGGLWPGTTPIW